MKYAYNYQKKIWGSVIPSNSPFSLAGLRFHYFLKSIKGHHGKLLEIGCGAGGNLQALRRYRPYLELYGADIGEAAIREGKRIFPRLNLEVCAAEHLLYDNNFFDIVCFFDVLEHVDSPQICLKEAYRVLKNDGVFHAYIPCEGELLSLHGILNRLRINLKEKTAGHIQKLTKKEILRMVDREGFVVVDCVWSCHLLNQIGDLGYYLVLTVTGKQLEESFEAKVKSAGILKKIFLSAIKGVFSLIWYIESRLFWWFPGAGIHLTCRKK